MQLKKKNTPETHGRKRNTSRRDDKKIVLNLKMIQHLLIF